jgi:hypothetical protein
MRPCLFWSCTAGGRRTTDARTPRDTGWDRAHPPPLRTYESARVGVDYGSLGRIGRGLRLWCVRVGNKPSEVGGKPVDVP